MILTGLSAFPITPSDPDGTVDAASLRRLVGRLRTAGVDSIGVLGSTGTYPFFSAAERRRALDAALSEAGEVPVLAGVGALRTDDAVRLAADARAAGAAAGLLAPVSYTPLTADEVFEHFATVARDSGLPLCIYDNPATTHFTFTPELVGRLSRLDGVVAMKASAPPRAAVAAHLAGLRAVVPAGFPIGYSGDWNAVEALIAGGDAWYSVIAGLFPAEAGAIVRAVQAGDIDEARRRDARLAPLWDLFRAHSSLRVMYACADLLGLSHAAPPRPILPLDEAVRRKVEEVIGKLGLDGLGLDGADGAP